MVKLDLIAEFREDRNGDYGWFEDCIIKGR